MVVLDLMLLRCSERNGAIRSEITIMVKCTRMVYILLQCG